MATGANTGYRDDLIMIDVHRRKPLVSAMTGFTDICGPGMCRRFFVGIMAAGGLAIGLQHLAVIKRPIDRSPTSIHVAGNTDVGGYWMVGRLLS